MSAPRLQAYPKASTPKRTSRWLIVLLVVATLVAIAWYPVYLHLRAVAVLLRIESSEAHGFFANRGIHPIKTEESTFAADNRGLRTRLYVPTDLKSVPAMVIVHGVHHLGYNEPRLVRFAKAISGAGMVVSTPELPEIAGYEIKPVSIEEIAAAADDLAARMHSPCVGVLGLSFAGGLALSAASDPATSRHICYVVAIGAHDDMSRVMKFFATDRAEYPDGHSQSMPSHEYGALVAIYAHPEEYFPAADVPLAREAIRQQLFEEIVNAKATAAKMSPEGQATMQMLLAQNHSVVNKILLANLDKHRDEAEQVSPGPELYRLHVPVLLLHGAGDNVIPPSETLWLAKDIPAQNLRAVLISPAISHVEVGKGATLMDKFRLVHFIVVLLGEAKDAPYNTVELQRVGGG
ncbi:alpha/beta hydrolase [Candidatus Korobacter versatilis]|nr:alpha/beta hydrolase [Candidatus Koribacter versatilis]